MVSKKVGNINKGVHPNRIPESIIRKGVKQLRDGVPAMVVMRTTGVSYPTVLRWKHEYVTGPKARHYYTEDAHSDDIRPAPPETAPARPPAPQAPEGPIAAPLVDLRKATVSIDVIALLQELADALSAGCQITLAKDRDRFIAKLDGLKPEISVFTQNKEAPLAVSDVIGKWRRQMGSGNVRSWPRPTEPDKNES
jgi:hypothetical protein